MRLATQTFLVENKTGAGGLIAGEMFAKLPPDGYTLFVGAKRPDAPIEG